MKTITVIEKHLARKKVDQAKNYLKEYPNNDKWIVKYENHDTRFKIVKNNENDEC
jgi:hypothetical protein